MLFNASNQFEYDRSKISHQNMIRIHQDCNGNQAISHWHDSNNDREKPKKKIVENTTEIR